MHEDCHDGGAEEISPLATRNYLRIHGGKREGVGGTYMQVVINFFVVIITHLVGRRSTSRTLQASDYERGEWKLDVYGCPLPLFMVNEASGAQASKLSTYDL